MGYIRYESQGEVGLVTFSRPEALNALSRAGIEESLAFFQDLGRLLAGGGAAAGDSGPAPGPAPGIRALVLTGAGKAFIAGADVKEMSGMGPEEASRFSAEGNHLMIAIERLPVPVIAAVNGYALGGGFEVALAADFIYAASGARMGLPEASLGIIPGFGGVRRLCLRIGAARAKELVYSGRQVTAQEALELGIVNRVVVPPGELLSETLKAAASLGNAGRQALRAAKRQFEECLLPGAEEAAAAEAERFGALFAGGEPSEGMTALLEKRKPSWARKQR
jgi:enoyl-CoA hydratase